MNEILQVAMLAGQMILENGGETYRVEETIWRICKIYGYSAYCKPVVKMFTKGIKGLQKHMARV